MNRAEMSRQELCDRPHVRTNALSACGCAVPIANPLSPCLRLPPPEYLEHRACMSTTMCGAPCTGRPNRRRLPLTPTECVRSSGEDHEEVGNKYAFCRAVPTIVQCHQFHHHQVTESLSSDVHLLGATLTLRLRRTFYLNLSNYKNLPKSPLRTIVDLVVDTSNAPENQVRAAYCSARAIANDWGPISCLRHQGLSIAISIRASIRSGFGRASAILARCRWNRMKQTFLMGDGIHGLLRQRRVQTPHDESDRSSHRYQNFSHALGNQSRNPRTSTAVDEVLQRTHSSRHPVVRSQVYDERHHDPQDRRIYNRPSLFRGLAKPAVRTHYAEPKTDVTGICVAFECRPPRARYCRHLRRVEPVPHARGTSSPNQPKPTTDKAPSVRLYTERAIELHAPFRRHAVERLNNIAREFSVTYEKPYARLNLHRNDTSTCHTASPRWNIASVPTDETELKAASLPPSTIFSVASGLFSCAPHMSVNRSRYDVARWPRLGPPALCVHVNAHRRRFVHCWICSAVPACRAAHISLATMFAVHNQSFRSLSYLYRYRTTYGNSPVLVESGKVKWHQKVRTPSLVHFEIPSNRQREQ